MCVTSNGYIAVKLLDVIKTKSSLLFSPRPLSSSPNMRETVAFGSQSHIKAGFCVCVCVCVGAILYFFGCESNSTAPQHTSYWFQQPEGHEISNRCFPAVVESWRGVGGKRDTDLPCAHTECSAIKKSPKSVQLFYQSCATHQNKMVCWEQRNMRFRAKCWKWMSQLQFIWFICISLPKHPERCSVLSKRCRTSQVYLDPSTEDWRSEIINDTL